MRVHKFVKKSCDLAGALAAAVVDWRTGKRGQVDAERREQSGERGAERTRGAVLRLQRDAEAVVVRGAEEAFCAALREPARRVAHELVVDAVGAADEVGVRAHRVGDPLAFG